MEIKVEKVRWRWMGHELRREGGDAGDNVARFCY